jgi:hypothetical protein
MRGGVSLSTGGAGLPVVYEFDPGSSLIRTTCTGDVSFDEVVDHFRQLEGDPALPGRLDVLLDLSDMRSLPESAQLKSIAREVDRLRTKVQWGACAIVATRDAMFGMSRMFEVLAESYFSSSHVFRGRREAESWLASVREPRGPTPSPDSSSTA